MPEPNTSAFDSRNRLRALAAHWRSLANGGALPERSAVQPAGLRRWLGNVLLVDVVSGGAEFVYRVYGTNVAVAFGRDLTGATPGAFPPHHLDIIVGAYREVVSTAMPRYTAHILSIEDRKFAAWERIVLPLTGGGTSVDHLLVGIYRFRVLDMIRYRASLAALGIEPAVTEEADGAFL